MALVKDKTDLYRLDSATLDDVRSLADDMDIYYVAFDDELFFSSGTDRWAFMDVKDGWKFVSPAFESIKESFRYPLFDGKSILDLIDAVEFYGE